MGECLVVTAEGSKAALQENNQSITVPILYTYRINVP
jgi:hypothetical protein